MPSTQAGTSGSRCGHWRGVIGPTCPRPSCVSPGVAHTPFASFPPCLVPAVGWAAPLGAQEGRQEGFKPSPPSKQAPAYLALTLESSAVMKMESHLYPGEAQEAWAPGGSHLRRARATPCPCLLPL